MRAWGRKIEPDDAIEVVSHSPGSWTATSRCSTSTLWVFLVGHYRTFHWTQHGIKEMAHSSSGGCYMVSAVMPEELCVRGTTSKDKPVCEQPKWYSYRSWQALNYRSFTPAITDVPVLLEKASTQTFDGRLAYAVIRRRGALMSFPHALLPTWHLAWAVAEWSGRRNGFTPSASAVVIRTRPDAIFTAPFNLQPLQTYFERGLHGAHLVLVQHSADPPAQTDIFMVTSFGCYANDIARPLEGISHDWGASLAQGSEKAGIKPKSKRFKVELLSTHV